MNEVPSIELCKRMAELGICQDAQKLWYAWLYPDKWMLLDYKIVSDKCVIAPTLSVLLEALPEVIQDGCDMYLKIQKYTSLWSLYWSGYAEGEEIYFGIPILKIEDKHIPNAVAKALISLAEKKGI